MTIEAEIAVQKSPTLCQIKDQPQKRHYQYSISKPFKAASSKP